MPSPDFRKQSQKIVTNFLQTVMIVDDNAYFENEKPDDVASGLIAPGSPDFSASSGSSATLVNLDKVEEVSPQPLDIAHGLNVTKLIEDFARRRIVCAVLRPKEVEMGSLEKKVYPLAESCDILIFDWVLHGAIDGGKVKQLISDITKKSVEKERRLRLIVIYTGEDDLAAIAEQIQASLIEQGKLKVETKNPFTIESGPVRIAIFAKGNVPLRNISEELAQRVIPIERLPMTVIAEFTDMTMGLISNVAIASLAALRANTHRVLTTFYRGLDAPFLAHRSMLTQPGDAGELLMYLIGAELSAILQGEEVSRIADTVGKTDMIRAWLESKQKDGFDFESRFNEIPQITIEEILKLLRVGVANAELEERLRRFKNDPHKRKLTNKFTAASDSPDDMEHRFAVLTSLKSNYRIRPPALLPGSILKLIEKVKKAQVTSYWLCIQPICDSVRIKEKRAFPLLPLSIIEGQQKFDLVFPDAKTYRKAKVNYSPYRLSMTEFEPAMDGFEMVRAVRARSTYIFRSASNQRYQWLAELKFEHAQRIINEYAATLSRVGLDESEWLRRSSSH